MDKLMFAKSKTCKQCGKEYTSKSCDRRGWLWSVAKYCSRECFGLSRRTSEDRICKSCGKTYSFKVSQLHFYKGANQFCSKKCHGDFVSEDWKDKPITDVYGRTKRRADNEWRIAVKTRDGYICKRCGTYNKNIHAHHIALRGRRPDLKHDVSNGMCLCNSCHTWVHKNPKLSKEQGYMSSDKYELAHPL